MDAPPIQYAKTSDGVSIAFWAIGKGPPLVILGPLLASHVQLEWEMDTFRAGYERLSERATVIRFDCRGQGLSQRDCLDLSVEAQARDLEAVVDHMRLQRFAVYGSLVSGELTFAYPGNRPERVSHLIFSAPPSPRGYLRRLMAVQPLMDQDWELFTEIWGRLTLGWDEHQASRLAARIRASHTPETFALAWAAITQAPEPRLSAIHSPTLILHGLGSERGSRITRDLAAGIAGAHLLGSPTGHLAAFLMRRW
jgi:pimeloyl-ACP methyl ester carboxylesterase